jgi:hypothetical protein
MAGVGRSSASPETVTRSLHAVMTAKQLAQLAEQYVVHAQAEAHPCRCLAHDPCSFLGLLMALYHDHAQLALSVRVLHDQEAAER